MKTTAIIMIFTLTVALLTVTGCGDPDAERALEASKYTSEVAQAIIESGWKLSGAVFLGLILSGVLSSSS